MCETDDGTVFSDPGICLLQDLPGSGMKADIVEMCHCPGKNSQVERFEWVSLEWWALRLT